MTFVIKQTALQRREPEGLEKWVEYQPGVRFLIRGITHRFVQIGLQAKREQQMQIFNRFNSGDMTALKQGKTEGEIGVEMIGELVVADWEGLRLEDGSDLPYTPEASTAIFSDPEYSDLAVWAMAEATKISQEVAKRTEARLGKPSSASDGKPAS